MSYKKTVWETGDIIIKEKLNNIEDGIYNAHYKLDEINKKLNDDTAELNAYVTKEKGNANQITFADGQTFQAKLDAGTLKGVGIQSIVTYYRASSSSNGVTKEANN